MDKQSITLTVNGRNIEFMAQARKLLSDALREDCGLTGTHVGCEHGVCGACTVLVNGLSARSCLMLAVQCDGQEVATVESLAKGGKLNPLQQAFQDCHGLQCGFCTPGILMTLTEFLRDHPAPDEAAVRDAMTGNICRCTGYQGIVDAVLTAAERMRETRS